MQTTDLVTALFQIGSFAAVIWDIVAVLKAKNCQGFSLFSRIYGCAFGAWMVYFVLSLHQPLASLSYLIWTSLFGVYTGLCFKYSRNSDLNSRVTREGCAHVRELRRALRETNLSVYSEHGEDGWVNVNCKKCERTFELILKRGE